MSKKLHHTAQRVSTVQQNLRGVNSAISLWIDDQAGATPLSPESLCDFVYMIKHVLNASLEDLDQVRAEIVAMGGGHD